MTTPPGWYPDPGHKGQGPVLERWWDGSTWTDYTREPQGAVASQIPPQQQGFGPPQPPGFPPPPSPAMPGYPPLPPAGHSRGKGKVVAIAGVAAVLVAAIVIGGIVLLNGDGGSSSDEAKPKPSASAERPDPDGKGGDVLPEPGPSGAAKAVPDLVNGITMPVLDGWQGGRSGSGGAAVTTGPYPCPGEPQASCVRGGVFTRTATGYRAKNAEGVAKEDIAQNAEDSYGKDPRTGKEMYGGVTSHRQIKSEPVTVAGQKGYLVRWKVDTEKGDGGYVQSLAFPSPYDQQRLVLVRFGFDASDKAPPLTDMNKIAEGIAALGSGGGSGGTAGAV
jgi:hypothetical protein